MNLPAASLRPLPGARVLRRLALGLVALLVSALAAAAAGRYHFVGFYDETSPAGRAPCVDRRVELRAIASVDEYQGVRREFLARHRGRLPNTYLLNDERAALVVEYTQNLEGLECRRTLRRIFFGRNLADAQAVMTRSLETPARDLGPPRTVFTWEGRTGSGGLDRIERKYEEFEYALLAGTTNASGTTLHMQGRNLRSDAAAAISVIDPASGRTLTLEVAPSAGFNWPLGRWSSGFTIEVQFRPADPAAPDAGLIDWAKALIRDAVTDGEVRELGGGVAGPRG